MLSRAAILALFAFTVSSSAFAEEVQAEKPRGEGEPTEARWRVGARNLKSDAHYLVTFPTRVTRRGVVATSAAAAGILGLVFLDERIRDGVQARRSPSLDRWENLVQPMGNLLDVTLASVAVYGVGLASDSPRVAETGRALLESLTLTTGCDLALKGAFGRDRPGGTNQADSFFHYHSDGWSFPSGHTATAFAWATVLAERHGRVAAWIAYPLATMVGLSRVEGDKHWASDALAAGLLGQAVSKAVTHRREHRLRGEIAVVPGRGGFLVVYRPARWGNRGPS